VAAALLRAGRFEEAAAEARQSIAFDPNFPRGHSALGWALIALGEHAEGVAEMEWAERVSNGDPTFLAQLGEAYATVGRSDEARAILRRLETLSTQRVVSPYTFAYVHTGLGEHERALDYLEQAYAERAGAIFAIKGSFLFVPLRGHPRFKSLLARMHLA
jgi:Flp pilus assembly protein TadD